MKRPFSCIIPAYNEASHVGDVITVVSGIPHIGEIVCVDDGSTDGTPELIEKNFPHVKVVRLSRNSGKSAAVKRGCEIASGEFVLLLDADLRGLSSAEIAMAIDCFLKDRSTDMIIMRRMRSPLRLRCSRIDVLLAGERILRRSDLEAIFAEPVRDYGLELAINMFMLKNRRVVYWAPSSAKNTFKFEKLPPLLGLLKEARMYISLLRTAGLRNIFLLLTQFGRQRVPKNMIPGYARFAIG